MSFAAFSWEKTFSKVCNAFFPMVMATEVGEQNISIDKRDKNSVPNKISAKCVNTSLAAEQNGVASRMKLQAWSASLHSSKLEDKQEDAVNVVDRNGEQCNTRDSGLSPNGNGSNCNSKSDVSSSHLRELLLLHLDLIQQQQQQIQEKDKEIVQLKDEKEQLEARLKRMERRMAVRRQSGDYFTDASNDGSVSGESRNKGINQKRKPSMTDLMRRKNIPATAPVVMSSKVHSNINIEKCLRTANLYLEERNNLQEVKNCEKIAHETVKQEVNGSDVPTPKFRIVEQYSGSVKTAGTTTRSSVTTAASVVTTSLPFPDADTTENLDDDTFNRRHQRPETDEKKRKRWDIQHYRALKQREELQERYKQREEARLKGRKCSEPEEEKPVQETFIPNYSQLIAVEMCDTVPVTAFGSPIQSFESSEFNLPWFSLDKREFQEREKLRTKSRGRRKSGRKYCM